MNETFFCTPSIRLHGCRHGEGPLVIYLHGITANWSVWEPVLTRMSPVTTGVAISQRGHGQSDQPPEGYGPVEYAADVVALIEHLNIGPAIVVGHSLGARNAVVAAAARPELVSAVLSVDFVPHVERSVLDALAARVNGGARTFGDIAEVNAYLSDRYRRLPPDAIERRARNGYRSVAGSLLPWADPEAMRATAEGLYADYEVEYRTVSVPTIAIRGEHSTLVTSNAFKRAKALRPDIEHIVIEGVDHYVPEEDPLVIAELTMRLLSQTES